MGVTDILAKLGGIFELLIMCAGIALLPLAKHSFKIDLMNKYSP